MDRQRRVEAYRARVAEEIRMPEPPVTAEYTAGHAALVLRLAQVMVEIEDERGGRGADVAELGRLARLRVFNRLVKAFDDAGIPQTDVRVQATLAALDHLTGLGDVPSGT